MKKAVITYAEFKAFQEATRTPGTLANLIERYIKEMNARPNQPPLGDSHQYGLLRCQRYPIARKLAAAPSLTKGDFIEFAKERIKTVKPVTINGELSMMTGVLKYAGSAWSDCAEVSAAPIVAARPFLVKNGYIDKGTPRTRVPTDEEIEKLLAFLALPPKFRTKLFIYAMPDIVAFALVSSRRLEEICSIDRERDLDWDHKDEEGLPAPMYWVRNMKHPKKKIGNDKRFPIFPELEVIIRRQPIKPGDSRVFPFNHHSVGSKYVRAKKALNIVDLHFHDNRREAITNWLKKFTPHQVRHFISGHENTKVLERVYDATDPAGGHAAVRAKQPTQDQASR